jgi:hypothetical protein
VTGPVDPGWIKWEQHDREAHLSKRLLFGSDEYRTDAENCWCNDPPREIGIAEWLLRQIEADEANARACNEWDEKFRAEGLAVTHKWVRLTGDGSSSFWGGCPTPRRVLTDCAARRRIVELHADNGRGLCVVCVDFHADIDCENQGVPCDTLRALAASFAGRDGYREEWGA